MLPAPIRVPSQWPLARSVTSDANDNNENDMIPGAMHRSPGSYLTAEENPWKTSAMRPSMKAVRPVITSNGVFP